MLPLRGFCMHWRRFEAEERRIITNQWISYLSSQFCKVDNVQMVGHDGVGGVAAAACTHVKMAGADMAINEARGIP